MPRNFTTRLEIIKIHEMLKTHLVPSERAEGHFKYIDDWSDEKIAKAIDKDLTAANVAGVRKDVFGHLDTRKSMPQPAEPHDIAMLAAHMENLDKAVADLRNDTATTLETIMKNVAELADRHKKLCETLALNKVANVKHLA